jgi:hypothetical protein
MVPVMINNSLTVEVRSTTWAMPRLPRMISWPPLSFSSSRGVWEQAKCSPDVEWRLKKKKKKKSVAHVLWLAERSERQKRQITCLLSLPTLEVSVRFPFPQIFFSPTFFFHLSPFNLGVECRWPHVLRIRVCWDWHGWIVRSKNHIPISQLDETEHLTWRFFTSSFYHPSHIKRDYIKMRD